ncbi:uncharacterized protein LOC106472770 isoform X2 [Limulus polyphemus]|uniref:Uncharacterized protein LOC106472770 isoform X2 n=1 Tax=Limulus polyphemus TaxID=6850 RepID=A0ABM1TQ47_LIMPO|nr:uncharacterized protein LOC106472770 isoform X2 [Limulus polyphemus]
MGTCYSRKITSEDLYYYNLPMEPPKSGHAPRSIRSSPYNRNVTDSCGLALKKRPLLGSKLPHLGRLNFASEKHSGFSENASLSSNLNKNRPSKLHILVPSSAKSLGRNKISPSSPSSSSLTAISQINQENKTLSPTNANFVKSKPESVDSNFNKCNTKNLHMIDNNDNISSNILHTSKNHTVSNIKSEQDIEKFEEIFKKPPSVNLFYSSSSQYYSEPAQNIHNQSIGKEGMGDHLQKSGLPIRTFQKPSKLTSFISGIRKPQERQLKGKIVSTSDMPQKETGTIEKKLSDNSYNVISTKDLLKDEKLQQVEYLSQPKKNKSDSPSLLNSQETCINSSGKHRDRDSGLGNSFSEMGIKAEDSDTLKDAEHFSSFEGSPVFNKSYEPSLENLKFQNSATSIQATQSQLLSRIPSSSRQNQFQANTSAYRCDKKEDCQQKSTRIIENSFPQSYGSFRGILAYRKIPPMKFDEGQTHWKKFQGSSSQNTKRSYLPSNLPNIPKPAISKCEKQISSENQITVIATTSEKTHEDRQHEQIDSDDGCLSSLLLQTSEREKSHMSTSQVSQNTTDSTLEEQSCFSLTYESDNREFLIDDEIADQPGLVTFGCGKYYPSGLTSTLQESVTELSALQENWKNSYKNKSAFNFGNSLKSCSDIASSCSSLASDDMMLDFEANDSFDVASINTGIHRRKGQHRNANTTFNNTSSYEQQFECRVRSVSQPTPMSFHYPQSESDDGSVKLDVPTYKLICQDMNSIKTQLLHLKSVLHEAETLNPFDTSTAENVFYQNLVNSDLPSGYLMGKESIDVESPKSRSALTLENSDLRRQVILLQEQLEEKDCVIRLLQQQMTECTAATDKSETFLEGNKCNSATQTERVKSWISSQNPERSYDDSSATLVSLKRKISSQVPRKTVDVQKKKDEKWKTAGVRRLQSVKNVLMSSQC